jgi:peptidoglycan/xylan/chitin deacetylase (PgdA/CDA1 family)
MLKKHLPPQWSDLELTLEQRRQASMMHIHDEEKVQVVKYALNFLIPYEVVDHATSRMLVEKGITEDRFCQMTFMSTEEIEELSSEGHIIGLHGHDHAPLSSFDPKKQASDIERNASILEKIIGFRPTWLSYPYGRPDALPNDPAGLCKRAAISLAFTLISGFNETGVNTASLCRITPNELKSYLPAGPKY